METKTTTSDATERGVTAADMTEPDDAARRVGQSAESPVEQGAAGDPSSEAASHGAADVAKPTDGTAATADALATADTATPDGTAAAADTATPDGTAATADASPTDGTDDAVDPDAPVDPVDQDGTRAVGSSADAASDRQPDFEPLTDTYERLRHSTDSAELSGYARAPLPDRSNQAAFSRATALLEAVAGNAHTPVEDRVFLATTMPFPNILVKLSADPEAEVRRAVAANEDDKNWLVGRLTKDRDGEVRDTALRNPRSSWKMRLEGAQDPEVGPPTLDALADLGVRTEPGAPAVLSSMVRRAVALNPGCPRETLERLARDGSDQVARAARARLR
ncbi:AbrB family transcriptional regulator [Bifidobacterium mongoliense DSM 21395]|uniref:AbrB family transcriptional regulator n=1 Tax=Bifidobacterium mongoliense DSM 21395 TaxID=1437603 RepID=A0A087BTI8_9BIFI|nr:AbrB family transcriptional regulator [Bifidobacterium mongoliense DSM 21395]